MGRRTFTKTCLHCATKYEARHRAQSFCSVQCANRNHLNNKSAVSLPQEHSVALAELFGILLGDGSVTQYFCKVYLNAIADKEYAPYVCDLCSKLFPGASVTLTPRPQRGVIEIQVSSCDVSRFLTQQGFSPKERTIPTWIQIDSSFTEATIRGLFDTEGSVGIKHFQSKSGPRIYRQLTFTNRNQNLLYFVRTELQKRNYRPTLGDGKNIYISNRSDIARFSKEIGFSNPKLTLKVDMRT